jgi:hypothetical protein
MTHETPTLEEMSKDPRFAKVTQKTLERWSKEDQWVERRSAFFSAWKSRAKERLGTELCRLRQRDLADLETIRSLALEKLTDEMVMPKSWEGVAKILLEATEHRDRIATAVGAELMPGQGEQKQLRPEDVGASSEELQLAAKEILRHRRDSMRLTIAGALRMPIEGSQLDSTVPTLGAPAPVTPPGTPGPAPVIIEGRYVTPPAPASERVLSIGTGAEPIDGEEPIEDDRAVFEDDEDEETS